MSSRRTAVAQRKAATKPVQHKRAAKLPAAKPVVAGTTSSSDLSNAAVQLAAQVERGLASGATDVLSPQALQALMAAACNLYSAQVEAGHQHLPLKPLGVPPTAVMATASGILRAANLAVFELGMWQSWTGR
ncbi:MAG: hypothetical protein JOZ58_27760 [Acetobacteraceae bacterium]|nr:hypothetical protein [Acetobacteraceae bacterium]